MADEQWKQLRFPWKEEEARATCRVCTSNCADCGIDTFLLGEWYMVESRVWEQAWVGRRRNPYFADGQFVCIGCILCIGCLEQRIGRTLMSRDFTDARVNNPDRSISERMRDRLRRQ
jgi:hypothetical protein